MSVRVDSRRGRPVPSFCSVRPRFVVGETERGHDAHAARANRHYEPRTYLAPQREHLACGRNDSRRGRMRRKNETASLPTKRGGFFDARYLSVMPLTNGAQVASDAFTRPSVG